MKHYHWHKRTSKILRNYRNECASSHVVIQKKKMSPITKATYQYGAMKRHKIITDQLITNETNPLIKSMSSKESQGPEGFTAKLFQIFQILTQVLQIVPNY